MADRDPTYELKIDLPYGDIHLGLDCDTDIIGPTVTVGPDLQQWIEVNVTADGVVVTLIEATATRSGAHLEKEVQFAWTWNPHDATHELLEEHDGHP